MSINLGNVVGLLRAEAPPDKTYVLWGKINNPSFPDLVEINYYDALTAAWVPITDPTTQHWLRPVIDNAITAPPGSPAEGDRYMVPVGASGAWTGKTDQIATFKSGVWVFQVPLDGYIVSVRTLVNTLFNYAGIYGSGGAWVENDFQVPIAPGAYIPSTEKGVALGVAILDSSALIPIEFLHDLPYTPAVPANWPGGLGLVADALDYVIGLINTVANTEAIVRTAHKVAHSFAVGNVITIDNTGAYVKVTDPSTMRALGIVTSVVDVDNFKLSMAGFIGGLSSLTPGAVYYVQATGLLGTTITNIPFLLALTANSGHLLTSGGGSVDMTGVWKNKTTWDASAGALPVGANPAFTTWKVTTEGMIPDLGFAAQNAILIAINANPAAAADFRLI